MEICNDSCSVYWRHLFPLPGHAFPGHRPHLEVSSKPECLIKILSERVKEKPASSISLALCGLPAAVHFFRAVVPFPSPAPGGRASGVTAVPAAAGGQRKAPLFWDSPFCPSRLLWPLSKGLFGMHGKFLRGNHPDEPLKPRTRQRGKANNLLSQQALYLYCLCYSVFLLCLLSRCFSKSEGLKNW